METFFINLIFAFILLLMGLMFLEGIWHKKGKIVKNYLDIDNFFFPDLRDKRLLKVADQMATFICFLMAVFTLFNGLIADIFKPMPNVSMIFIFVAIFLSWPARIIFIYVYRNKAFEEVPRIWPFRKPV